MAYTVYANTGTEIIKYGNCISVRLRSTANSITESECGKRGKISLFTQKLFYTLLTSCSYGQQGILIIKVKWISFSYVAVLPILSGHVETVVLLSHKKVDATIDVKLEFGEGEGQHSLNKVKEKADKVKLKDKVTYKMIQNYIEEKYGFKVHSSYIAEVKRDLGLPMYDAPNAVEELKQPRKHPTPEKVKAIKDTLKHFDII